MEKLRSCFCYFLSRFCEENFCNIFTQAYVQTCSRVSKHLTKISQASYFGLRHEKFFTWHLAYGRHFQGDAPSSFWHAGSHSQRYSELRSYPKCRSSREGVELLLQSSSLRWYCYPRHTSLNNRKTSVDRSCIPRRTTFKRWKPSPKSALPYHSPPWGEQGFCSP